MVTRETYLFQALSQMGIAASAQVVRRLALLADLLENDAVELGFLGPNEGQRVVSRHLLESAALLPYLLPDDHPVVDVGSGAGLPGLVLAALGRKVVLIESQVKRVQFLRSSGAKLGVDIDVRHERAEDAGRGDLRDAAGSVVARALAAPTVAFELCLPMTRPGGRLLLPTSPEAEDRASASEAGGSVSSGSHPHGARIRDLPEPSSGRPGPRAADDTGEVDRWGELTTNASQAPAVGAGLTSVAAMLGAASVRWQELSVPGVHGPRWVMMVDKRDPTPDRFPRRPGVPKRRPLGGDVASVN